MENYPQNQDQVKDKFDPVWSNYLGKARHTMHYRARAIKEGRFRFANLASHFIRIQIFQIDLPPILSASKYFR